MSRSELGTDSMEVKLGQLAVKMRKDQAHLAGNMALWKEN